jgi:cell division protein FtsB
VPAAPVERALRRERAPRRVPGERSSRRGRRIIWPVLACILFVGILFVGVFPTQTYLEQREEAAQRRAQLEEINARNAELQARVDALQDDDAVEALARKEWGLVYPGEESYAVVGLPDESDASPADAGD